MRVPKLVLENVKIEKIVCGKFSTFILKEDGDLLVAGANLHGSLGLGTNKDQLQLTTLMKDEGIKDIAVGEDHALLLKWSGELFVFGV